MKKGLVETFSEPVEDVQVFDLLMVVLYIMGLTLAGAGFLLLFETPRPWELMAQGGILAVLGLVGARLWGRTKRKERMPVE